MVEKYLLLFCISSLTIWNWDARQCLCYLPTQCLKKVYSLTFDNNFGKCGPIFKILSPVVLCLRSRYAAPEALLLPCPFRFLSVPCQVYFFRLARIVKFFTALTIVEKGTLRDLLAFLKQSLVAFHKTRRNDWQRQWTVLLLGDTLSNYYILMLESMLMHMHSLYALSLYGTDCLLILCYLPISNNLKWQSKTLTFRMHLLVKIEFKNSSRYAIFLSFVFLFCFLYSLLFGVFIALCLWFYLHLFYLLFS